MAKSGVHQDTVLRSLLFLIYINDIESQISLLLMVVPFTDQHILKVIPLVYKKIYLSGRSGQIHGK